jgi:MFS family permease
MGIGIGASQTSSYAVLTLLYPNEVNKAVAIIEGSSGVGLATGPGFGSLMYYFFGFKGPFIGLAVIYFVFILFIKLVISDQVEPKAEVEHPLHSTDSRMNTPLSNAREHISYKQMLMNKFIAFA